MQLAAHTPWSSMRKKRHTPRVSWHEANVFQMAKWSKTCGSARAAETRRARRGFLWTTPPTRLGACKIVDSALASTSYSPGSILDPRVQVHKLCTTLVAELTIDRSMAILYIRSASSLVADCRFYIIIMTFDRALWGLRSLSVADRTTRLISVEGKSLDRLSKITNYLQPFYSNETIIDFAVPLSFDHLETMKTEKMQIYFLIFVTFDKWRYKKISHASRSSRLSDTRISHIHDYEYWER